MRRFTIVERCLVSRGLITTSFDEKVTAGMPAGDGPWAAFNAKVAAATVEAYDGPLARFGGPPQAVAEVIEKALTKARPKPRYTVTLSAPAAIAARKLLGDRGWDLAMRTQFPQPR